MTVKVTHSSPVTMPAVKLERICLLLIGSSGSMLTLVIALRDMSRDSDAVFDFRFDGISIFENTPMTCLEVNSKIKTVLIY